MIAIVTHFYFTYELCKYAGIIEHFIVFFCSMHRLHYLGSQMLFKLNRSHFIVFFCSMHRIQYVERSAILKFITRNIDRGNRCSAL